MEKVGKVEERTAEFKAKLQDALDNYQKSTWYLSHPKELIAKPWGQKYSVWDDTLKMHLADYKIEANQDGTLKLLLVVDFDKEYKNSLACSMFPSEYIEISRLSPEDLRVVAEDHATILFNKREESKKYRSVLTTDKLWTYEKNCSIRESLSNYHKNRLVSEVSELGSKEKMQVLLDLLKNLADETEETTNSELMGKDCIIPVEKQYSRGTVDIDEVREHVNKVRTSRKLFYHQEEKDTYLTTVVKEICKAFDVTPEELVKK